MPKPFSNLTGNGCHFHICLWDAETNVFLDERDPNGLLSETAYHFIGGLRSTPAPSARDLADGELLQAAGGATATGATWSPVCVSYGGNNRTQMLRIPGPGRVEESHRRWLGNPYLSRAGVLAAGLDGIANGIDPGEPNSENLYMVPYDELKARGLETLPANLLEATHELKGTDVVRKALGRGRTRTTPTTSSA